MCHRHQQMLCSNGVKLGINIVNVNKITIVVVIAAFILFFYIFFYFHFTANDLKFTHARTLLKTVAYNLSENEIIIISLPYRDRKFQSCCLRFSYVNKKRFACAQYICTRYIEINDNSWSTTIILAFIQWIPRCILFIYSLHFTHTLSHTLSLTQKLKHSSLNLEFEIFFEKFD